MKRTPLKRKTPLRGKKRVAGQIEAKKRKKRTPRQIAEDKLWELCKAITRKRYQNPDGTWTCYTSGKHMEQMQDVHTGHGKPKGALSLKHKYDLRNLRPQCFDANVNLNGMTDIFIAKLEREPDGLAFLQEACVQIDGRWEIKREPPMGSMEALNFIYAKIAEYEKLLSTG